MDKYSQIIKTWDRLAQQYEDAFMNLTLYDKSYDAFCELLEKQNASILELGCGPGNVTKYLLSKRSDFRIHATDVAPSMLTLAQKNNPNATFEVLDCRKISTIKIKFDAIVCGFCLPYLSKIDCQKLIMDCHQLLHNDGLVYISMIEGDYNLSKIETSSDGLNSMFIHYYSEDFILKTFEENNFLMLETMRIPYAKKDGTASIHLICIAKKK